jgi:hypothetical protein
VKQTRYRAFGIYTLLLDYADDCMLIGMATAKPKTLAELEAQKKAIKEQAAADIAAIRKATAERTAALKSSERRIRAEDIRNRKKRENHAKILVGVAIIHQCQTSESSAVHIKAQLEEFYSDSPERLKNAFDGLKLIVKKPQSDQEQD